MKPHMTEPNPELAKLVRNTFHGMAHWAGSGPQGKTCATCQHFGTVYQYEGAKPKKDRCKLYFKMMEGKIGNQIPANTMSCKHYSEI